MLSASVPRSRDAKLVHSVARASVVVLFLSLFAFYLATAALMVWLTFRSPLSGRIQSFKGVVAPFFGSTAIIFGLLLAFLSNDIWDRNKQADRIVLIESNTLVALYSLGAASEPTTVACAPRFAL